MIDYSELIQRLSTKLEEFQYVSDTEILIPNVQYISYRKSNEILKAKNLCTLIDMPDNMVDYTSSKDFFGYLKKSLVKQYGDAFLWKELEMFFVVLCGTKLYELWESDQGKVVNQVSFSLNSLIGTCFVNKGNFDTFAVSTWGVYYSGDHFKAIKNTVEHWCKDRKQKYKTVTSAKLANSASTWQQSEGVEAQLGVKDKFGKSGTYIATFLVKNINGQEWKKSIKISGNQWGYVLFPDDFSKGFFYF